MPPVLRKRGRPLEAVALWEEGSVKASYERERVMLWKGGSVAPDGRGRRRVVVKRRVWWYGAFRRLLKGNEGSFCVESSEATGEATFPPSQGTRWYASFVVEDAASSLDEVLGGVPLLPASPPIAEAYAASRHAWVFVGSNESPSTLQGRPEHTDQLDEANAGTYHRQLLGVKDWFLRHRTTGVLKAVRCEAGDLFFVDTRQWYHRTELPPQDTLSVSLAFDFGPKYSPQQPPRHPRNVDALLAARPLKKGSVVLTEDDLPNARLLRRDDCNCQVRETDKGTLCLVATKTIQCGELFTVAPSDDDDDDDERASE